MNPWLRLLRPHQWYKNLVVFIPLVFSENLANLDAWPSALVTFAGFCLLTSAVYAANDALDADRDRHHPRKQQRPVASGAIKKPAAWILSTTLALSAFFVFSRVNASVETMGGLYLATQILYNLALKHVALWDALTIGFGFVIRALAGTVAIGVGAPTVWLIVCSFLLAFYLALGKRRHELEMADADPETMGHRKSLAFYSKPFLEQTMQASATLLLAAYTMYTVFGTDQWMMFTIPFAFYGIFRHNLLVHQGAINDQAELILRDRGTVANALLWFGMVLLVQVEWLQNAYHWLVSS